MAKRKGWPPSYKAYKAGLTTTAQDIAGNERAFQRAEELRAQQKRFDEENEKDRQRSKKSNPGVKLARTGHTGFLKARAVDVITRNGKVVEVRVKR